MDQEQEIEVPPYFLCPISLQIMKDPITLVTGITYDRDNIEKWLFTNNNLTCPVTKQSLIDTHCLTPNHTLRRLIQSWCTLNSFERFPTPKPLPTMTQILKLFNQAITSPINRAKCLIQLSSIALENSANKRCLENAGAVEFLLRIILLDGNNNSIFDEALNIVSHLHVSENKLKTFMNVSEGAGSMMLVDSLARAMQRGGSHDETRANAIEFMKRIIQAMEPARLAALRLDHLRGVVRVVQDQVTPRAVKSALQVLILTCPWGRNKVKAVNSNAVTALIDLLMGCTTREGNKRLTEMILVVLDQLCGCAEGRAELVRHPGGLAVVSKRVLRVSPLATDSGVKILASVSRFVGGPRVVQEMVHLGVVAKLCMVVQMGFEINHKTKERAKEILKLHCRTWKNSPCAPSHVFASLGL